MTREEWKNSFYDGSLKIREMPEMFENWQEEVEALKAEIKKYNEIINGLLTQIEVLKKETENLRAELKWERQNHITR